MAEMIYSEEYWKQIHSRVTPLHRYAYLEGYSLPSSTDTIRAYFGTDSFLPDFEHITRSNRIQLIKGAALQHTLPASTAIIIDIVGWCRTVDDKNTLMRLYYSNYPELPAPYPTEFLLIRKDYYILRMPDGRKQNVRFAETPVFELQVGDQKRPLWVVKLRFNPIIGDADLYEL